MEENERHDAYASGMENVILTDDDDDDDDENAGMVYGTDDDVPGQKKIVIGESDNDGMRHATGDDAAKKQMRSEIGDVDVHDAEMENANDSDDASQNEKRKMSAASYDGDARQSENEIVTFDAHVDLCRLPFEYGMEIDFCEMLYVLVLLVLLLSFEISLP